VSPSHILGLLALNLWLLVVGTSVLFGLRGWASWAELARLSGLAYMCGVAAMGIVWVWQLTVSIDFTLATIFGSGLIIAFVAALLGHRRGRRFPAAPRVRPPPVGPSVVAALSVALTAIYFEAQFRSGRLAGLYEFDGWAFWVPKAKAIYYFAGLDTQFFHDLPGQSYPPLVPALAAGGFHFMGGADEVTLHLQFWFVLVGFVAAVIGLLSGRVQPMLLWPSLLFVLVTPHVVDHALQVQADFLLDEFFALSALLLALWIRERNDWQLGAAALFLGAAMMTKREGYVLGVCALLAAAAVTSRQARSAWPKLLAVGVIAALVTVPWRALLVSRGLEGGGPEAGGVGLLSHADRAWPSLRLTLSTLFDFHIWLAVVPVLVLAIAASYLAGERQVAAFAAALALLCVAAFTWSTWAFPSLPITKDPALNPIVRFSGALILTATWLIPLLLTHVERTGARRQ
jgi:hypothetical protein